MLRNIHSNSIHIHHPLLYVPLQFSLHHDISLGRVSHVTSPPSHCPRHKTWRSWRSYTVRWPDTWWSFPRMYPHLPLVVSSFRCWDDDYGGSRDCSCCWISPPKRKHFQHGDFRYRCRGRRRGRCRRNTIRRSRHRRGRRKEFPFWCRYRQGHRHLNWDWHCRRRLGRCSWKISVLCNVWTIGDLDRGCDCDLSNWILSWMPWPIRKTGMEEEELPFWNDAAIDSVWIPCSCLGCLGTATWIWNLNLNLN